MMSDEDISGEQMLAQNMAALEAGDEMPHSDDSYVDQVEPDTGAIETDDVHTEEVDVFEEEIPDTAKKDGYMSKEDWVASGKDPDEYMTADEFARVGDMRDGDMTRQQLAKQLVQQQAALKEIIANQNKIAKEAADRGRREAIAELEEVKRKAIDYGDAEKAIEIDREINRVEQESAPQPEINPVQQDMQTWYEANDDWYGTHNGASDLLNVELKRSERQGIPFTEAIKLAEAKVKGQFGYLFGEPEKAKAAESPRPRSVSSQSRKPANQAKTKLSLKSLPPEMQSMARTVIKKTGITEQEYMESYNG
jgi:hypothetical protein